MAGRNVVRNGGSARMVDCCRILVVRRIGGDLSSAWCMDART